MSILQESGALVWWEIFLLIVGLCIGEMFCALLVGSFVSICIASLSNDLRHNRTEDNAVIYVGCIFIGFCVAIFCIPIVVYGIPGIVVGVIGGVIVGICIARFSKPNRVVNAVTTEVHAKVAKKQREENVMTNNSGMLQYPNNNVPQMNSGMQPQFSQPPQQMVQYVQQPRVIGNVQQQQQQQQFVVQPQLQNQQMQHFPVNVSQHPGIGIPPPMNQQHQEQMNQHFSPQENQGVDMGQHPGLFHEV